MTREVTAFQATDGRLFHTMVESHKHDVALIRAKKFDDVFAFLGNGYGSIKADKMAWYILDHWDTLKRIVEGGDASR